MSILFFNNFTDRLVTGITAANLTIEVVDGSPLAPVTPSTPTYLTIADPSETFYEIVKCTGVSGNILTIERAQDGTSATIFPAQSFVDCRIPSVVLEEFVQRPEMDAKANLAGDTMDSGADLTFSGGGEVLGLPATPSATGASSKEYTDSQDALKVAKAGDTMTGALYQQGSNPLNGWHETDASADNGRWDISFQSEALYLRTVNDAYSVAEDIMRVDRTGTTIDLVEFGSNVATTAVTPTADAHLARKDYVDTKATISGTPVNNQLAIWTNGTTIEGDSNVTWDGTDFTITGNFEATTITSTKSTIAAADPHLVVSETDQAPNEGNWDITSVAGQFRLRTANDTQDTFANVMTANRTGTTVNLVEFWSPVGCNTTPSSGFHLTRKDYVDLGDQANDANAIAYAIALGS